MTKRKQLSAGAVVARREGREWRLLVLRAYRNWDFPKGEVEPGEDPFAAAKREVTEETGLIALSFPHGEDHVDTTPYAGGKIARYYLGVTEQDHITLPVSPELGRPEHHEWRWVTPHEARTLLPARLTPVLAWARTRLEGS